jgi:hypothetical protein
LWSLTVTDVVVIAGGWIGDICCCCRGW